MPAQSVEWSAAFTRAKPSTSSFRRCAPRVRVQLSATLVYGESVVCTRLLASAALSGSASYVWIEKRNKNRSLSDRFASIFRSPWWVPCD